MTTITIRDYAGVLAQIDAIESTTPGLAVHPARNAVGWTLTHVPSGRLLGYWPEGSSDDALNCASALAGLADWTTDNTAALTTLRIRDAVLDHGAMVSMGPDRRDPTGKHRRWLVLDDGEPTVVTTFGSES